MLDLWGSLKTYRYLRLTFAFVLGVAIVLFPAAIFRVITYVLFFYLFLFGGLQLIRGFRYRRRFGSFDTEFPGGITLLFLSFIVLFFSKGLLSLLPILLGLFILFYAIGQIRQEWLLWNSGERRLFPVFYSLFVLFAGLVLLLDPFGSFLLLFRIFGSLLIIFSIANFFFTRKF